jgi:hypothetical protein
MKGIKYSNYTVLGYFMKIKVDLVKKWTNQICMTIIFREFFTNASLIYILTIVLLYEENEI